MDIKRCSRCRETKSVSEFCPQPSRGGYQSYCRACATDYQREWQAAHAERLALKRAQAHLAPIPNATKTCRVCGEEKPLVEFYAHRDTKDRRATHCKACQRARAARQRAEMGQEKQREVNAAYHAGHRDEARRRSRSWNIRMYGISVADYDAMVEAQGDRCAICRKTGEETGRPLGIDHDHETNAVRGLLCNFCNSLLGFARDDEDVLLAAIDYLRTAGARQALAIDEAV